MQDEVQDESIRDKTDMTTNRSSGSSASSTAAQSSPSEERDEKASESDDFKLDDLSSYRVRLPCAVCGRKRPLKKCSRCQDVFYCSDKHQKRDWRRHRRTCKPITQMALLAIEPYNNDIPIPIPLLSGRMEDLPLDVFADILTCEEEDVEISQQENIFEEGATIMSAQITRRPKYDCGPRQRSLLQFFLVPGKDMTVAYKASVAKVHELLLSFKYPPTSGPSLLKKELNLVRRTMRAACLPRPIKAIWLPALSARPRPVAIMLYIHRRTGTPMTDEYLGKETSTATRIGLPIRAQDREYQVLYLHCRVPSIMAFGNEVLNALGGWSDPNGFCFPGNIVCLRVANRASARAENYLDATFSDVALINDNLVATSNLFIGSQSAGLL